MNPIGTDSQGAPMISSRRWAENGTQRLGLVE